MKKITQLLCTIAVIGLLSGLLSPVMPVLAAGSGEDNNPRFIVRYRAGADSALSRSPHGNARRITRIPSLRSEVLSVSSAESAEMVAAYRARADVECVEPDYPVKLDAAPNDPDFAQQWGMTKIRGLEAWDVTKGSAGTKIAILDTGIDLTHPDLRAKVVLSQDFTGAGLANDNNGHGSHCAGVAAAVTNNSIGVTGVGYNCSLLNGKVLDSSGSGYYSSIASGIIWAADNGANVISLSLGGSNASSSLQQAIDYAWNKGAVVVAAAGNNGSSTPCYPAYYTNCIAVAATDENDARYYFSNYGAWVDVAAPGSAYSTYMNGGYSTMSGTSMATPHVAGLAGLVFSVATDTNGNGRVNDEVRNIIESTCDGVPATEIGRGRINALRAVSGGTPAPIAGKISGTVTSVATTAPLANVTVTDGTRTATTNSTGVYAIDNVPAGAYTVTATAAGYQPGTRTVTVSAGTTATANFALTANNVNRPPVMAAIGNKTVNVRQTLSFDIAATDADGDRLTCSVANLPTGASFNSTTRTFTWSPIVGQAGRYGRITFIVSDGKATASEGIFITVNPAVATGQINGRVTDAATGFAVAGATVSDGTRSTTTSANGAYYIPNIPAGSYVITARAASYETVTRPVSAASGASNAVNFTLKKAATGNSMWVEKITATPTGKSLNVNIKVVNPQPVNNARVMVNFKYNGSTSSGTYYTRADGTVNLTYPMGGSGVYTVEVSQLTGTNYTWDKTKGVTSATYKK